MEKQKSPVKIKNFTINNKYGTEDVVINKNTTIHSMKMEIYAKLKFA